MPTLHFTENLRRHLACDPLILEAKTVSQCLEAAFARHPKLRSYLIDDQGRLRPHVNIYIDGEMLHNRLNLQQGVRADSEIYVMQALSGG